MTYLEVVLDGDKDTFGVAISHDHYDWLDPLIMAKAFFPASMEVKSAKFITKEEYVTEYGDEEVPE